MKQETILEVKDLTVKFSGKTLLNNISFTIKKGETLAVIGASGSGKTTLIKSLTTRFENGNICFGSLGKAGSGGQGLKGLTVYNGKRSLRLLQQG